MKPIILFFIGVGLFILIASYYENFAVIKKKAYDNNHYYVQDYLNNEIAVDVLAKLVNQSISLIEHLNIKYPDNPDVKRLKEKFNPEKVREAEHEKNSTSYTINKGEMVHLCIRDKDENKNLHEHNLLMFVVIHELAHIMSKSIGHNNEFYNNFKFLLNEASTLGIYYPIDFKKNPEQYCGIEVNSNPYYNS